MILRGLGDRWEHSHIFISCRLTGLTDPFEPPLFCDIFLQVSHLKSVKDTELLRTAHSEIQPKVVALSLKATI